MSISGRHPARFSHPSLITGESVDRKSSVRALRSMTNIQNCQDEPIRIPGSIQRHGFMLLLEKSGDTVVGSSENAEEFLGIPLKLILGARTDALLPRELLAILDAPAHVDESTGLLIFLGSYKIGGEMFSVVTHRVDGERVLEFERLNRLVSPELMNSVITNFVVTLGKLTTEIELLQAITRQVKELTGFNRVILYQFDRAGHGTVLAEENDGKLPSFLNLRFPASDIPQQARDLYLRNTIRIIPDANYTPSPLHGISQKPLGAFDLSMSLLRSVSPIHIEYMRNMGTAASMSISIVCEGKLWGLISCHHGEPSTVPYLVRSACDLLTKIMASQLAAFRTASSLQKMVHFHAVQRKILTHLAAEPDYGAAIAEQMKNISEVATADGAALVVDGQCEIYGNAPTEIEVRRLVEWLDVQPKRDLFESHHLEAQMPWAGAINSVASGLLAISISDVRQSYVLWFRPEVVSVVNWAGEIPSVNDGAKSLTPRHSFESWKELVRGRSLPWTEMEIQSAQDFRSALMTINLRRAEEAFELSEARFKQLTHTLPNLVWTANDDGQLTYVNQRWLDEGLGAQGKWYEQARLFDEDESKTRDMWHAAVETGASFEQEVRVHVPSNPNERWILVRAVPFLAADRSRAGWVGTCTDLTDRREREAALRIAEKLALTGRMTSVIAHEINNPLEAITNLLYLLRMQSPQTSPTLEYLDMAQYELERISGITKQTLRWSKEKSAAAESSSARALFEDVVRLFSGKIRNRAIRVTIAADPGVHYFGVVGQIRQVVANLLSNAIDAVAEDGHICLEAREVGPICEFIVRDDGMGMNEKTVQQIMHPFFSTKGDLGNGLGLYISNEIVERHGGHLTVASTLGEGSTFKITLPARFDESLSIRGTSNFAAS
jgi:PAS domain S-box-containing protein